MPSATRPPARCLVRVEPQPWGVFITVTVDRDTPDGASDPPRRFAAPEEALAAVAAFLAEYA